MQEAQEQETSLHIPPIVFNRDSRILNLRFEANSNLNQILNFNFESNSSDNTYDILIKSEHFCHDLTCTMFSSIRTKLVRTSLSWFKAMWKQH